MARIAIALTAAALAPGCASKREAPAPLVSIPPAQIATRISGATPKQRAVLLKILAGIGPTSLETVEVIKAAKAYRAPPDAVEVKIETARFGSPRYDGLADLHAKLVAEAFVYRSRQLGLPPVAWFSGGSGGQAMFNDPSLRPGAPGLTLVDARGIAERIRKGAERHNATVRRLELLRPRRLAFVVVLQTDDPTTFLSEGYDDTVEPLEGLRGRGHDGRFIEVLDGEGRFVMSSGAGFAVSGRFAGCFRSPFRNSPPPCPTPSVWKRWWR